MSQICKMTGDSWHLYQDDLVNNNAFAVRKRESGRASVRARAVPSMRKNEIPYISGHQTFLAKDHKLCLGDRQDLPIEALREKDCPDCTYNLTFYLA